MALVNKKITPDELVQNLVNARKILKKVDTGDYEKGNINEKMLVSDSDDVITEDFSERHAQRPVGNVTPEKVNSSRLPDNIKKAMIEHPIPQITLNDGLDMEFVNRTKQLMEKEGVDIRPSSSKQTSSKQTKDFGYPAQINESKLEKLIENAVRKVLDEKLNQILAAQQLATLNENLVLKVGDSIFQGKITGVKSTKGKK